MAQSTSQGSVKFTNTGADGTSYFTTPSWSRPSSGPLDFYTVTVNLLTRRVRCTCHNHRSRVRSLDCEASLSNPGTHCKHIKAALAQLGQDDDTQSVVTEPEPVQPSTPAAQTVAGIFKKYNGRRIENRRDYAGAVAYGKRMELAQRTTA